MVKNRTFGNFQINIWALNVKLSPPNLERRRVSGSLWSEIIMAKRQRGGKEGGGGRTIKGEGGG